MDVTVYSAYWCRDCREAKRFLTTHNIPFKKSTSRHTPGAADLVLANVGKRAIPQFVIDGKWVQPYRPGYGFLHDEMAELFGVANPDQPSSKSPEVFIDPLSIFSSACSSSR